MGNLYWAAALRNMSRPSLPLPWKAYGLVRGLNAPPRIRRQPASCTYLADKSICSCVSTEHGPAITWICLPPSGMPAMSMTVFSLCDSRDTILYCLAMCIADSTPGSGVNISSVSGRFVADRADHGALDAARNVRFQACRFQPLDHCANLLVGDIPAHYDNHLFSPSIRFSADKNLSFSLSRPMLTRSQSGMS